MQDSQVEVRFRAGRIGGNSFLHLLHCRARIVLSGVVVGPGFEHLGILRLLFVEKIEMDACLFQVIIIGRAILITCRD